MLGSWLCFGSCTVPMKTPSVIKAGVDPVVFQCWRCFWTFVSSWIVLLWHDLDFTWWGVASGISWVPASVASVIAVRNIGIAIGQMTWQLLIIVVSFCWGLFLKEKVHSVTGTCIDVSILITGLFGMAFAFSLQKPASITSTAPLVNQADDTESFNKDGFRSKTDVTFDNASNNGNNGGNNGSDPSASPFSAPQAAPTKDQSAFIGFSAAIFNGLWGGSNLVPLHFAPDSGIDFAISFAIGSLIVSAAMWLFYVIGLSICRRPIPCWHVKVMFWPGFLAGTLWTAGNICSIYAVRVLGQAIGYSCVQASVLISGAWGILWFRELEARAATVWLSFAALSLFGAALLSQQRVQ